MKKTLMCAVLSCWIISVSAQVPVRKEDHFFRRKVVNRISLVEKINSPLVYHESEYYGGNERFTEQDGIVASLINGLKSGKYHSYHPDSWDQTLNYEQIRQRMKEFDSALDINYGDGDAWSEEDERDMEVFGAGEEEVWVNDEEPVDNWDDEWDDTGYQDDVLPDEGLQTEQEMDLGPYEEVIHMVEDRIFDKTRSMMVNEIDFFEIIWVDPSGSLPEKVLARFRWDDVKDQLDVTKWKTKANDASELSIAQAFELRLFHGFLINVGGTGVRTLWEAEERRQDLIEFEHHLWSY